MWSVLQGLARVSTLGDTVGGRSLEAEGWVFIAESSFYPGQEVGVVSLGTRRSVGDASGTQADTNKPEQIRE